MNKFLKHNHVNTWIGYAIFTSRSLRIDHFFLLFRESKPLDLAYL